MNILEKLSHENEASVPDVFLDCFDQRVRKCAVGEAKRGPASTVASLASSVVLYSSLTPLLADQSLQA